MDAIQEYGLANNRPGRAARTERDQHKKHYRREQTRQRRKQERRSDPPPPPQCPHCNSYLAPAGYGKLRCVLCETRDYQLKYGRVHAGEVECFKTEDGQVELDSPLCDFVVAGALSTGPEAIYEPRVVSEDLFMPVNLSPGSMEKLNAMRDRYQQGLPVFHSEDGGTWDLYERNGANALREEAALQQRPEKDEPLALDVWDLDARDRSLGLSAHRPKSKEQIECYAGVS